MYLKNQQNWNRKIETMIDDEKIQLNDRCRQKNYRHKFGKPESYTLIGLTGEKITILKLLKKNLIIIFKFQNCCLFIHSLDDSFVELKECFSSTNLINWNLCPLITALNEKFHSLILVILESKGVEAKIYNHCSCFWLSKTEASEISYTVPNKVELRKLEKKEAKLINSEWPFRYPGSEGFIGSLIDLNGGYGIYLKQTNQLVPWILLIECNGLGLLQTVEKYQGNGYARILIRALSIKISCEYNEDVILFANQSKPKTVELYLRNGFSCASDVHWIYLQMKSNSH